MDAYEQVVRARIKAAVTLFSLSVLMALGIWLLNRTLLGNIDRYLAAREWYRQTLSMQGKMRAYEGQGENLFQALALAAIILRNSQLSGMSWNLRSVHEPVYGNIVDWDGGDSTTQA